MKLIIEEPESEALARYLESEPLLATSEIALVEVLRATAIANPAAEVRSEAERLLGSCMLVDVSETLLRSAATLASAKVRTLDAVHLASALRVQPDEVVVYDRRLLEAAAEQGLAAASPGAER